MIKKEGPKRYLLVVSDQDFDLPLEEIAPATHGLGDLKKEISRIKEEIENVERDLDQLQSYSRCLENAMSSHLEQLEFATVSAGMGTMEHISYLQGYCPTDDLERLKKKCNEMGWGLMIEEISEEGEAPTLLRNPRWVRIVEPVFSFMGTVPGYGEFDLSFWFLISLSLFFAMLIGDGGYGLLFLAATLLARLKYRTAQRAPFLLLSVFSIATIIWGLMTGTWFGIEYLSKYPVLSPFVIQELNSFTDNQDFMIHLCFTMGAIHLTIAHVLRGVRYLNSLRVLGELGWICILWFLYFLAGHLVLFKPLPGYVTYLLVLGIILAAQFSNPQKPFFASAFRGLADLPLDIIRSFSDLVSYLRLFAVGYATLVVAVSFNQMASDLGWSSFVKGIAATIILLFGHTMNILLGAMAVLVHGIRLNMLEFSSHLGMNWSGQTYKPFKRRPNVANKKLEP
jgi:V/A-type H+-transporting ATPase subunit I